MKVSAAKKFLYARLKNGTYYGNTCGRQSAVRRSHGLRSLSKRVFIRYLSNLVDMLVGIISRPSSITSQIPKCTPEVWPLKCPKLGFPLSKSKSFRPVLIKLCECFGGHNISTKFYNQPNPPGSPESWSLNCPKLGFPLSKSNNFYPVFP